MEVRNINKYGWKPSIPDPRDIKYSVEIEVKLPEIVDLREKCPPVYNQLQTGSCTANAWAALYEYLLMQKNKENWMPSRLFIYFCERAFEGTTGSDSGAMLRDGAKALNKMGTCHETTWPFDESKVTVMPNNTSYIEGLKNTILNYQSLNSLYAFKKCLASGTPFVFGFTVFESFETTEVANTGIMPMPDIRNERVLGGHGVCAVGYDDTKKVFIVRNSWGESWGDKGYFYMPYEYITNPNLASDFWTSTALK